MKRIAVLLVLALALPLAAFATSSVDCSNAGGTLAGTSSGLSLTGSELIAITGYQGPGTITGGLGGVSFSTGSLLTGSLQMGGTFNGGGAFVITSNGSFGLPNGTLFSGSFSGPLTWTLITLGNGTHEYTLTGTISGTWYNSGTTVYGATVQLTINTGKGFFNGSTMISSGDTNIAAVPEPGTLGLLGTGLLGLAGVLHRKMKG